MVAVYGIIIDGEDIQIAYRGNVYRFYWLNPLSKLLPDNLEVEVLEGSPEGIYTIGDIKREIKDV